MLKNIILNTYSQIDILSSYMLIRREDINSSIRYGYKLLNTYRNEKIPSLSFKQFGNKIITKDFGDLAWSGDIFQIVGKVLGLNSNNNKDFIKICEHIICRFRKDNKVIKIRPEFNNVSSNVHKRSTVSIEIQERKPSINDYLYYYKQGITPEQFRTHIKVVNKFWINNKISSYYYTKNNPCFCYTVLGNNKYKLYFPFRDKHSNESRFITNNKSPVECLDKIKYSNLTLLVKSYKDKLLIERLLKDNNFNSFQVFSLSSEVVKIKDDILNILRKYTKSHFIFNLLDNDNTGKLNMIDMDNRYNFINIIFTQYGKDIYKDPTDMCSDIGYDETNNYFKKYIKNKIRKWTI
jgi:hypothetical protein